MVSSCLALHVSPRWLEGGVSPRLKNYGYEECIAPPLKNVVLRCASNWTFVALPSIIFVSVVNLLYLVVVSSI
jgi:hypothetical protein